MPNLSITRAGQDYSRMNHSGRIESLPERSCNMPSYSETTAAGDKK